MSPTDEPSRGKAGRPRADADLVSASIDGNGIAWLNGEFAGNLQLVRLAIEHAAAATPARLRYGGPIVNAGSHSPEAAAAAMVAIDPGRAVLTDYPESVAILLADTEPQLDDD